MKMKSIESAILKTTLMIATDYKINHQLEDTVVYFVEAQTGKKGFLITKKIVYLQSFK